MQPAREVWTPQAPHIWIPDWRIRDLVRREDEAAARRRMRRAGGYVGGMAMRGRALARVSSFSPLDEGNGSAWIDLQDAAAYTTSSGFFATVTNKVSSTVWSEATNRPAVSTAIGGFNCADFDGTNDRIISNEAGPISALSNSNAFTLFIVGVTDAADAVRVMFAAGNSGQAIAGSKRFGTNTTGAGRWNVAATNDAATGVAVDSSATADTNPHVFCFRSTGTQVYLQIANGAADPSAAAFTPGTLTPNQIALGCRPSSTATTFWDGKIGEVILYSVELSTAAITRVHDYLDSKWGL